MKSGHSCGKILYQGNPPAHIALSVRQFLSPEKHITVLDHLSYSPDLAQCDFFSLSALMGTHFKSLPEVKKKMMELIKEDLLHCFD